MAKFPHLKDAPDAFGPGREVYEQIPGAFDHERWSEARAHVRLLSVPWCGDYDNVVAFGSDEARDAWIDAQPCVQADSAWRRAPDTSYRVEVPYTSALDYNYLVIDLPEETGAGDTLPGVSGARVGRLCYFVQDMLPVAPSTTELVIDLDIWTTFINRIDIRYAMLERGHAPMSAVSADAFLADPVNTSRYVASPDVSVGEASVARTLASVTVDATTMAVIFTTANINNVDWGGKYGYTPTQNITYYGSYTGPDAWALPISDLAAFFDAVSNNQPSFLQTVLAVAVVPASLMTLGWSVTFCGHTLQRAGAARTQVPVIDLEKGQFGYDSRYANIAKLYTWPYAHLELTDESGAVTVIRVEDTAGALAVNLALSLSWGDVRVDSWLDGYGATPRTDVTWQVLGGQPGAQVMGRWYETLRSHDIALYSVRESAAVAYDWSTHYDREQRQLAATNANTSSRASNATANANALASNATANANALASNATAQTNTNNSAANVTNNNALNVALNNANTSARNASNSQGVAYSNNKIRTDVQYDIGNSNAAFDAQMAQLGVAATNNDARAAAAQATGVVGTVAEVAANALTGDVGGAIGAAVGGVMGAVNTAVDWQTSNASITVSQSNNVDVYNQAVTSAYGKQDSSLSYNNLSTNLTNTTASTINTNMNNTQTATANNNASLMRTNASNSRATGDANANRTLTTTNDNANRSLATSNEIADRTLSTAQSAIANDVSQAALGAPRVHGTTRPGTSATRPMLCQVAVVTESDGAIAMAGDEMLRFGYEYHGAWEIDEWVGAGHEFAYWQLSDLWIGGVRQTPERYQSRIRDIMARGVTVWRDPDKIGEVSVYDNGY